MLLGCIRLCLHLKSPPDCTLYIFLPFLSSRPLPVMLFEMVWILPVSMQRVRNLHFQVCSLISAKSAKGLKLLWDKCSFCFTQSTSATFLSPPSPPRLLAPVVLQSLTRWKLWRTWRWWTRTWTVCSTAFLLARFHLRYSGLCFFFFFFEDE